MRVMCSVSSSLSLLFKFAPEVVVVYGLPRVRPRDNVPTKRKVGM